ncbi:MAG: hypothetical protein QOJ15_4659, partial [Bradyrhizobium sp.]|nr:hypothetical protein [Bradyrhizobium sp.]
AEDAPRRREDYIRLTIDIRLRCWRDGSGARAAMLVFKDDTLRADDTAFFHKVRDVVEAAASEATFRLITEKMQKTMGIRLSGDPTIAVGRKIGHVVLTLP